MPATRPAESGCCRGGVVGDLARARTGELAELQVAFRKQSNGWVDDPLNRCCLDVGHHRLIGYRLAIAPQLAQAFAHEVAAAGVAVDQVPALLQRLQGVLRHAEREIAFCFETRAVQSDSPVGFHVSVHGALARH